MMLCVLFIVQTERVLKSLRTIMKLTSRSNGTLMAVKDSAAQRRVNLHLLVQQIHLKLHTSVLLPIRCGKTSPAYLQSKQNLRPLNTASQQVVSGPKMRKGSSHSRSRQTFSISVDILGNFESFLVWLFLPSCCHHGRDWVPPATRCFLPPVRGHSTRPRHHPLW